MRLENWINAASALYQIRWHAAGPSSVQLALVVAAADPAQEQKRHNP
jgi:hypothetical protein